MHPHCYLLIGLARIAMGMVKIESRPEGRDFKPSFSDKNLNSTCNKEKKLW